MQLNSSSIHDVGSLLNLTVLHILHQEHLDFAPLQHLSCLQHLALWSGANPHEECFHGVLESSRVHLQTIQLKAMSCSD